LVTHWISPGAKYGKTEAAFQTFETPLLLFETPHLNSEI
jgi:hypothetical protein